MGYAVLIRLSAGYPPVKGRLVTRYAPVRHYGYCYPPFDLHVLGLPLAFILSQDQTLHCRIFLHLLVSRLLSWPDPTHLTDDHIGRPHSLRKVTTSLQLLAARQCTCSFVFPSFQRTCVPSCRRNLGACLTRPVLLFLLVLPFEAGCKDTILLSLQARKTKSFFLALLFFVCRPPWE